MPSVYVGCVLTGMKLCFIRLTCCPYLFSIPFTVLLSFLYAFGLHLRVFNSTGSIGGATPAPRVGEEAAARSNSADGHVEMFCGAIDATGGGAVDEEAAPADEEAAAAAALSRWLLVGHCGAQCPGWPQW